MASERLYVIAYDIADRKRWQKVFKTMKGYGHWLQLSVFQCRLTARRRFEMTERLEKAIKPSEDHVVILDLGPAGQVEPRVESLGKSYDAPGSESYHRLAKAASHLPAATRALRFTRQAGQRSKRRNVLSHHRSLTARKPEPAADRRQDQARLHERSQTERLPCQNPTAWNGRPSPANSPGPH